LLDKTATVFSIGQFTKSVCDVTTNSIVFIARFDDAVAVAPFDADANGDLRVVVG
jgi:hypothetical protein